MLLEALVLLETVAAIHRASFRGDKGHFALLATVGANGLVHFTRSAETASASAVAATAARSAAVASATASAVSAVTVAITAAAVPVSAAVSAPTSSAMFTLSKTHFHTLFILTTRRTHFSA